MVLKLHWNLRWNIGLSKGIGRWSYWELFNRSFLIYFSWFLKP
jgi:hypothetical protein